jgi:hypothetical protein
LPAALLLAGKRVTAPAVQLFSASLARAPLLHLTDDTTHVRYLVDSGAALSLLPHRSMLPPSGLLIINANGGNIPSWQFVDRHLHFGNNRFTHSFLQANVSQPILGADFLQQAKATIDFNLGRVCFPLPTPPLPPQPPSLPSVSPSLPASSVALSPQIAPDIAHLLKQFPSVISPPPSHWPQPAHNTTHAIHTTGPPLSARARHLSSAQLNVAKNTFEELERLGIVSRSQSAWASPLHMVLKPNGTWRPCGDYCHLNAVTVPDKYPLPNLQDLLAHLHGSTIFSKLDLEKGYYQVPMQKDDIPKTAIITPFGLFQINFMPFGLKNAAQTFQRLMDTLFRSFPFLFIYLDDLLIFSPTKEQHLLHLQQVFDVLASNGLRINPAKCTFAVPEVDCLGHHVTPSGLYPLSSKVQPILSFPPPTNLPALQRFLGMLNFYRRLLPAIAHVLRPLTDACSSQHPFQWTPAMNSAFHTAKSLLASAVPLHHPIHSAVLSLATDASESHVGAVLQQKARGSWQPLAFFSHKLSPTETRYSTFDQELMAAYLAVRHFRFFLEGCLFTLFTDHKPLVTAISKAGTPFSSRQQRHLSFLSEFTTTFSHLPGSKNVVADALSRPSSPFLQCASVSTAPLNLFPLPLSYSDIAQEQQKCPSIPPLRTLPSLHISSIPLSPTLSLLGDISTPTFRPLIPLSFRQQIFQHVHSLGHLGIRTTRRLLTSCFLWDGMAQDINLWARQCIPCQTSKVHKHISPPPASIPIPSRRFSHIHVDLVGPLPSSQSHTHIFTIIDQTTRWVEAVPLPSSSARACADALCSTWISRFGVPRTITSDRGSQFVSSLWTNLSSFLNVSHITTTAFHPQSNGILERFHRRLKATLRARCTSPDWVSQLPWVLLSYRASPHDSSNLSPAEAVLGSPLILPAQFPLLPEDDSSQFLSRLHHTLSGSLSSTQSNPVPFDLPPDLLNSSHIFVRSPPAHPPLAPLYKGPFKVLQRLPHSFRLQMGPRTESISMHRLKPAHLPLGTLPAMPPRRGRPPNNSLPSILKSVTPSSPGPRKTLTFALTSSQATRPRRNSHPPSCFSDFLL